MDWRGAAKGESVVAGIEVPLRERLGEIRRNVDALLPPDRMAPVERAIAEVQESGLPGRILPVGALAPAFELPDQTGQSVRSADLLGATHGGLVILFYRGRWCPYDVATLETWNQWLNRLGAAKAGLVAISPQKPQHTFFTADQHRLRFPVLSDAGNAVARQFGLVYRLPDYLQEHYRRVFVNLPNTNGDQSWELPLTATYLLCQSGKILFAHTDPDFRVRAEPEAVAAALGPIA